jgi:hypothetical protein
VWWLRSVIPTIQGVKMGRIATQSQPGQKVSKTPISINQPSMIALTQLCRRHMQEDLGLRPSLDKNTRLY